MEEHTLINVNNYLNTNTYSYLDTSGGQSSILYLTVVNEKVKKTCFISTELFHNIAYKSVWVF